MNPALSRYCPLSPPVPIESKIVEIEFSRWNSSRTVPITRLARISAVMLMATTTLSSERPTMLHSVATTRITIASSTSVPFEGSSKPTRSAR